MDKKNNDINTGEFNKVKADNLIEEERILSDEEMDKLFGGEEGIGATADRVVDPGSVYETHRPKKSFIFLFTEMKSSITIHR